MSFLCFIVSEVSLGSAKMVLYMSIFYSCATINNKSRKGAHYIGLIV